MIKLMKNAFFNEEETRKKLSEFILRAEKLSMGEKCNHFEKEFAKYQGRNFAVFVNSGSSANLALLQAMINTGKLKRGDSVGFSAVTWATNVMPIIQLGLTPIPIDISLENLNVDIDNLESLERHLDAIFITNLLGFSGKLDKIEGYCKAKNILLLEDNCESLGSEVANKKLGNFGLASTFSFFVGHHLSTIEGGMICTDDKELYDALLMVRAHGWSRNLDENEKDKLKKEYNINDFYNQYTFYTLGYNFRPTEINGFLGIEQLKYINEIHNRRFKNFNLYQEAIKDNPNFVKLKLDHMDFISNFAYPLICKDMSTFKIYLEKFEGVEIRPVVGGSMVEQPFFPNVNKISCPNAKKVHESGFYIPNNPDLTDEEIGEICKILREII